MAKRTMNEIEKDYNRIVTFVNTTPVISINEIAESICLSRSEIMTSLAKHPDTKESIIAQLEKNKGEQKSKKKSKNETLEQQKKVGNEAPHKCVLEEKSDVAIMIEQPAETDDFNTGFVIDASITGIKEFEAVLSKLCATKAKIILTSITIKELEKLQKFHDIQARDARHILAMAAEMPQNFHPVLIDETIGIPDDCIIKYCADNKNKVSLLTSDKTMALKARMHGVQTQYFKQEIITRSNPSHHTGYSYGQRCTLPVAEKVGNKLYINDFNNSHRSILLISNNLEYTDGPHVLKSGDDVYLATLEPGYMTFSHYLITSLSPTNNCRLIYSNRIYKTDKIRNMPRVRYRSFMYEFIQRHDL